jgi:translation initiation factor IF-2
MTDSTDKSEKKLTLSGRKTLRLKKSVDAGQVRQSLSHGRNKSVVVEHKRRRVINVDAPAEPVVEEQETPVQEPEAPVVEAPETADAASHLTEEERAVRARVLDEARKQAAVRQKEEAERAEREAEENAKREAEEAERRKKEEADAAVRAEEDAKRAAEEEEARKKAEAEAAEAAAQAQAKEVKAAAQPSAKDDTARARRDGGSKPAEEPRKMRAVERPKQRPSTRGEPRRRESKLTIARALDDGAEERQRSLAAVRRAREKQKQAMRATKDTPTKITRDVVVPEEISVAELANRMAIRGNDVVRELMKNGIMVTVNDVIDADTAELIVTELGHKVTRVTEADVESELFAGEDAADELLPRAPVVTVMGHVDHGKTSLLDALRSTDVVAGEAGGITQHIGAYQVQLANGAKITFLDTPCHAAFTAMRARGAQATDIVVLVVAADDGIMPQTIEAIQHAKAAEVPIIVAINKMDREGANPDRVRQELLQHEIIVEEMGGDVLNIEVSALKGTNLDKLEEAITLQAELLELKANPGRTAEGVVVESLLDKGRGSVATVLITRGTLRVGDVFVSGSQWGRVRAMMDDRGRQVKEALPSQPVEVLGLNGTPSAGDDFAVVDGENKAREISEYRQRQDRLTQGRSAPRASLEAMLERLKEESAEEFPVVIKADVNGSAEAVAGALQQLNTDEVAAKIVLSGVGGISESDVTLAQSAGAPILGFNVRASGKARSLAEESGVEIRYYSVIYDLVDDIKSTLSGMLAPEIAETIIGTANVQDVFSAGKGKAAGCIVTDGVVRSDAKARLLRDDVVSWSGDVSSVRRFKDEVQEVNAGTECGITLTDFNDIKKGDVIEIYTVEERERSL